MIPIEEIKVFAHGQFGSVQIIQQEHKVFFGAAQVSFSLGYPTPLEAVATHCRAESLICFTIISAAGVEQPMSFINEGDLYRLILNSSSPSASQYESWITDEIIPILRLNTSKPDKFLREPKLHSSSLGMTLQTKGKAKKLSRSVPEKYESLDDLFHVYYQAGVAVGRAPSTLKSYIHNYAAFCEYLDVRGVPRELAYITTELGRDYIIWLRDEKQQFNDKSKMPNYKKVIGLLPKSVNTRLKIMKAMFKFLLDDGLIEHDPFHRVKPLADVGREIKVLSVDELSRLLKAPDQRRYRGFRDYVILNVLIDGMLRINEALTLRKEDVDMQSGALILRREVVKTRKARVVPLTKRTIRLIRDLNKETEEFGSEYLFLTTQGETLTPGRFGRSLKEYADIAGLDKRTYPHLMRHSGATLFLESGGSARHLQMILGHSSARMTNHYTHLSDAAVKNNHDEYSALNSVIGNKGKSRKILRDKK
jgi:integrase/recombinase XerD